MYSNSQAEQWLKRAIMTAPYPLPRGRFPHMLIQGEKAGFTRDQLLDALDEWLNYGYCIIEEAISQDIEITSAGEHYFYKK